MGYLVMWIHVGFSYDLIACDFGSGLFYLRTLVRLFVGDFLVTWIHVGFSYDLVVCDFDAGLLYLRTLVRLFWGIFLRGLEQ